MRSWLTPFLFLLLITGMSLHAQSDGVVKKMSTSLNLRDAPSGNVLAELPSGTAFAILGRTANNGWLKVQTADGLTGWVSSGYVEITINLNTVPVMNDTPAAQAPDAAPVEAQAATGGGNGVTTAATLNLRAEPTTTGTVLAQLPRGTSLTITGRKSSNQWLAAQTAQGVVGWVYAPYVTLSVSLNSLPVTDALVAAPPPAAPAPDQPVDTGAVPVDVSWVISNINGTSRAIFEHGRNLGNRATGFSRIGDSISVYEQFLYPIGDGVYNLGAYGYLQGAIDFYRQGVNSFNRGSLSASGGWTTSEALNTRFANRSVCLSGETPLVCEYRVNKPAVALIMFGSNDVHFLGPGTFQDNLEKIVKTSIEMGVIPVLRTIPNRFGYEARVYQFNDIIREVAWRYNVPLWEFYDVIISALPNSGLDQDGLHLSASPRAYAGGADFTGDNLQYGYVMQNLTALHVLDALWRNVLSQ